VLQGAQRFTLRRYQAIPLVSAPVPVFGALPFEFFSARLPEAAGDVTQGGGEQFQQMIAHR
jgi:hypothetical protein